MSGQQDWRPLIRWLVHMLGGLSVFLEQLSIAQKETNIQANANVNEVWSKALLV